MWSSPIETVSMSFGTGALIGAGLPGGDAFEADFVDGDDSCFLFGVVLLFRSPAGVLLVFGTVDVRMLTELDLGATLIFVTVEAAGLGTLCTLLILLAVLGT